MIDPHIQGVLAAMVQSGFQLPNPLTPAALRGALDNPIPGPSVALAEQRDVIMNAGARKISARLYHSDPNATLPVTLFFHGGGWVHGTLDMFDRLCATLAVQADCAVLSVDYSLAPENPFPVAWEDALASLDWVKKNPDKLKIDPSRIALAGDSAGGNLAASISQAVAGDPAVVHQLLFYPVLDGHCASASYEKDHAGFLSAAQMRWYWDQYAPGELLNDSRASPILRTLAASLAPATIIVAGNDPLHDEGVAYAEALQEAGVTVALHDYPGAIHGFASLLGLVPLADEAVETATTALKQAFVR